MIFTVLTDGVLKAASSPLKIMYTCVWYVLCAFIVFAIHDFAQQLAAKALGDKTVRLTCNPLRQLRRYENWVAAACLILFWAGWKETIKTNGLNRPKKMLAALSGPLVCGVLCIPAYAAVWALDRFSVSDIFSVPFSALFTVLLLVSVFSLFFLPPYDGGTFIAQLLPWDLRDKFINVFDTNVSIMVFIVCAALLTQQGITRDIFESGFTFFGSLWLAVFGG